MTDLTTLTIAQATDGLKTKTLPRLQPMPILGKWKNP